MLSPSMALFLAGYPHGARQIWTGKRCRRAQLDPEAWLVTRCRSLGVQGLEEVRCGPCRLSCQVLCLVKVTPGRLYVGPFTKWSQEEEVLFQYLGCPSDAFSHSIEAMRILPDAPPHQHHVG